MTETHPSRPTLALHPSRSIPLYFSLVLAFEAAIQEGRIDVGDTLEPVSSLQQRLHWSPRTIRKALRTLEDRGVVRHTARATFRVVTVP